MRPVDAQSIEEGVTVDATGLEPRVAPRASRHLSPTPCLSARSSDGETCSSSPRRRRACMPPPRSPSSSDISSCVAPRGTLLDRASARHSARTRAHASGIIDGPPSSIDCASTGRTHSLHSPHVRDFDKSEWRVESSGTADRGRSIPNRVARAVLDRTRSRIGLHGRT